MNHKRLTRCITAVLVLVLLMSSVVMPLPFAGVEVAHAAFGGPNLITALFKIGVAWDARNRIYREAGATAEEINAYYDGLIAHAGSIRGEMIAKVAAGEIPARYARAYTRIEAALEAERRAAIQMIEAEKKQARRDFHNKLGKEIVNILIASPGGQRIIGQAREALKNTREAAVAVQVAAEKGRPIDALRAALARQVGDIPIVQEAARELGSVVGHGIDRALGGAIGKVEKAIDNIQAGMGEAIDVLDGLDAHVAQYDGQARRPVSLVEDSRFIGKVIAPICGRP
jgi:hypothetical protein